MAATSSNTPDFFAVARDFAVAEGRPAGDFISIDAIALTLQSKGMRGDDPAVMRWFEAALCRNEAEIEALRSLYLPLVPGQQHSGQRKQQQTWSADGKGEEEEHDHPKLLDLIKQHWPIAVGVLATLAVTLFAWWAFYPDPDPPVTTDLIETTASASALNSGVPFRLLPVEITEREFVPARLIALVAALFLIPLLLLLLTIQNRMQMKQGFARKSDDGLSLDHKKKLAQFFTGRSYRKDILKLSRHRMAPSHKIDVRASVHKTIKAAGFPTIDFDELPRSPSYIVIIERESQADHLTVIARALIERMTQEDVQLWHYEFYGSPDTLFEIGSKHKRPQASLSEVLARHPASNVLLCMERFDFERFDENEGWRKALGKSELPALLDPDQAAPLYDELGNGGDREVVVFPFSAAGLQRYTGYVESSGVERGAISQSFAPYDLPAALAAERASAVGVRDAHDAFARESFAASTAARLRDWLDPDALLWLRAIAIFPYVDPAFTIHLGEQLTGRDGKPLLSAESFFQLARLPWLRAGRFPRWLQIELAKGFAQDGPDGVRQLEQVRIATHAFLMEAKLKTSDPDNLALTLENSQRLADWLRDQPDEPLYDTLLINLLNGATPDQLAAELPDHLSEPWQGAQVVTTSLAVATALGLTVMPVLLPQFLAGQIEETFLYRDRDIQLVPPQLSDANGCMNVEGALLGDVGAWRRLQFEFLEDGANRLEASVLYSQALSAVDDPARVQIGVGWSGASCEPQSDGLSTVCRASDDGVSRDRFDLELMGTPQSSVNAVRICATQERKAPEEPPEGRGPRVAGPTEPDTPPLPTPVPTPDPPPEPTRTPDPGRLNTTTSGQFILEDGEPSPSGQCDGQYIAYLYYRDFEQNLDRVSGRPTTDDEDDIRDAINTARYCENLSVTVFTNATVDQAIFDDGRIEELRKRLLSGLPVTEIGVQPGRNIGDPFRREDDDFSNQLNGPPIMAIRILAEADTEN